MEVTQVKVFLADKDKLKAYAQIVFDNCFVVRELKVIEGNNGLFVAMPSRKMKDGTYKDTAHPLNSETRNMIEEKVIDMYMQELAKKKGEIGEAVPEVGEEQV